MIEVVATREQETAKESLRVSSIRPPQSRLSMTPLILTKYFYKKYDDKKSKCICMD